MKSADVRLMSWNIKSGGFNGYSQDSILPEREDGIKHVVEVNHQQAGVQALTLVDAFRWREIYGSDTRIATHLGYQAARFVELGDDRLDRKFGKGMGIVFASDFAIQDSYPLDLGSRQAQNSILDVGENGLQVTSVYLDDLSENERLKQARALVNEIESGIPTVLLGDFNSLRANMSGSSIRDRLGRAAVQAIGRVLPQSSEIGLAVKGMGQKKVVPFIQSSGFIDADLKKRSTAPSPFPLLGVDYAFHNDQITVKDFSVLGDNSASDHRPIIVELTTA